MWLFVCFCPVCSFFSISSFNALSASFLFCIFLSIESLVNKTLFSSFCHHFRSDSKHLQFFKLSLSDSIPMCTHYKNHVEATYSFFFPWILCDIIKYFTFVYIIIFMLHNDNYYKQSSFSKLLFIYLYVRVPVWVYLYHVCAGAIGGQKRASDLLKV